jgi:hypothetical protein
LLYAIWKNYDDDDQRSNVYGDLVSALRRIISEKPSELGLNESMQGIGVTFTTLDASSKHGGYLDMGLNAMSSAASVGVSTVSAMIGAESDGRLDSSSGVKIQW